MTISTIIPYRSGKQFRPADGPTICSRCSVGLLNRTSDRVEDTVDLQTNAELIVHIWEHDVDSEGRALCPSCSEVDDQTEAWRQLVTWRSRDEDRILTVKNSGVRLYVGAELVEFFPALKGLLTVPDVLAFVGRDPLSPGASKLPPKMETHYVDGDLVVAGEHSPAVALGAPPRFDLLAGAMHEATMEMGVNLRAWSDADELQPARDFAWADECPETERNTEHE